jgi:small ubiquitin-related modifier
MNRVFSAFYTKKNAQPGSYRFMFDGERLEDNDTAETKDMDDNCVVDVQLEQTGGR